MPQFTNVRHMKYAHGSQRILVQLADHRQQQHMTWHMRHSWITLFLSCVLEVIIVQNNIHEHTVLLSIYPYSSCSCVFCCKVQYVFPHILQDDYTGVIQL